jgi:hypothetical protein
VLLLCIIKCVNFTAESSFVLSIDFDFDFDFVSGIMAISLRSKYSEMAIAGKLCCSLLGDGAVKDDKFELGTLSMT